MTRSSLVARLSERFPHLMARDTELAVRLILDAISDALAESSRVEVRGFGSFALSYRPPRVGRNPKSGDQVVVPEKHVPHFKAGKELRERVDQLPPLTVTAPASSSKPSISAVSVGKA